MNLDEAKKLCRLVSSLCPSQRFDQYSPEAWQLILPAITYDDAKLAVAQLASMELEPGKSRYIEAAHIKTQVSKIRAKRLEQGIPEPPPGVEEPRAYLAWLRGAREAVASGRYTPPALETNREGQQLLSDTIATIGRKID